MTLWLNTDTGGSFNNARQRIDLDANPCISVIANGLGPGKGSHWLEDDGVITTECNTRTDKPPYRVPAMTEIQAIPWNGLTVASTFSGCGGSCTGYRMAGYRVAWANEFVPIARASYRANCAADSYLDIRDIKHVQPQDILDRCGLKQGDLDLFDGSPPCQAFSTAGKREKGWGKAKTYEHGATQCNETLFGEYIRLLRGLMPRAFVAENVSGLIKGVAKGYFLEIIRDLKASGYRVTCKVLDAQWLGVPQQRQRTIFVGVREDLNRDPVHPKPLPYRYSVRDALPDICRMQTGSFGKEWRSTDEPMGAIVASDGSRDHRRLCEDNQPCRSVTTDDSFGSRGIVKRKFTIAELKRICAFPDDFILKGSYAQQWERLGNSVPPVMMAAIASKIRDKVLT